METVGKRIKKLRTALGMSQVDFAEKIGVTKQTLYKYENGLITSIPSDKIEAAAKVGNIPPAYLMGWIPKYPTPKQLEKILSRYLSVPMVEHIMFEICSVLDGRSLSDGTWIEGLSPIGEPESLDEITAHFLQAGKRLREREQKEVADGKSTTTGSR